MKKLTHYVPARWKTIVALILALIAIKLNLLFIWGIFCFFWGGANIRSKEAYFVERIERQENPILYWMIIASWLAMGTVYFYLDGRVFNFFVH